MLRILGFFLLLVQFIYPQKKAIKPDIIKQDFFLDKCKFEEDQNIKVEKETNFYFKTGTNRSEYDFFMSDGLKEKSLIPQYGISLGIGILRETGLFNNKLNFSLELDLNELNQSYNYFNTSIDWKSNFYSLVGGFYIKLFEIKEDNFFKLFFGGGISKIVNGKQYFNNEIYDLSKHVEFDGLFLKRDLKLVFDLFKIQNSKISLGINSTFMKSLDDNSIQNLNFRNNSLFVIYEL